MKCIREIDKEWHVIGEELPPCSTRVELLQNDGTIVNAEIVVDMAGWYVYLNPGWGLPSDYTHWRFKTL